MCVEENTNNPKEENPRVSRDNFDITLTYILNVPTSQDPRHLVEEAILGGVTMVQLRGKHEDAASLVDLALLIQPVLSAHGVALIINDRLDVAMAVGADGVHLGKNDLPLERVRALAPDLIIGVSCYADLERARKLASQGADYLAFGSFYPSPTKPEAPPVSFGVIEEARKIGPPLVAIGGITADRCGDLVSAGIHGVAVISAIQDATSPREAACTLREKMNARSS